MGCPQERNRAGARTSARTVEAGPRPIAVTSPVGAGATAVAATADVLPEGFTRSYQPAPDGRGEEAPFGLEGGGAGGPARGAPRQRAGGAGRAGAAGPGGPA